MRVGNLEYAHGNTQFAAWSRLTGAAAKIDNSVTASNADGQVGVADGWQGCDWTQSCPAGFDVDKKAVVGNRRTVMFEILHGRIASDNNAFNHSSGNVFFNPLSDVDCSKYRPKPL